MGDYPVKPGNDGVGEGNDDSINENINNNETVITRFIRVISVVLPTTIAIEF